MGHLAGLGMFQHLDAFGAESRRECFADGRVFAEEQGIAGQDRDAAAESGESLCQFDCYDRRPYDG